MLLLYSRVMPVVTSPVFGKRNAPNPPSPPRAPVTTPVVHALEAAAIFAEARREVEGETSRLVVVPRSLVAALLAGLMVGFGLAGLDVTRADASLHQIAGIAGVETTRFLPIMLLFALLGGARAAATSLLIAHALLRRTGQTSHIAYAMAGGGVASVFALAAIAVVQAGLIDAGTMPSHGLAIDTAAGAGAGFLYRVLAGAQPA